MIKVLRVTLLHCNCVSLSTALSGLSASNLLPCSAEAEDRHFVLNLNKFCILFKALNYLLSKICSLIILKDDV